MIFSWLVFHVPSLPSFLPFRLQLRHLFPKISRLAAEAQAGLVEAGAGVVFFMGRLLATFSA
jgi:hypothetical protein